MVLGLGPLDLTTTRIFFIFQKINGQTKKIEISHQLPYQMAVDSCRRLIRQLAVEFSGWAAEPTLWQEDYSSVV
jgi:hypothetical protein